jgi:hypothetical protein
VGVRKKMGEKEYEGRKEDRDVETKVVAFNPESLDFLGMLHRVHSYSLIQLTHWRSCGRGVRPFAHFCYLAPSFAAQLLWCFVLLDTGPSRKRRGKKWVYIAAGVDGRRWSEELEDVVGLKR